MKYPLEDLRRIRSMREDRAARLVARERQALAAARSEAGRREQILADFVRRRPEEEETLFRRVARRSVQMLDVDEFRAGIEALQASEAELAHDVEHAKIEQAEAQKRSEQADADHRRRVAELDRLNEHKDRWQEEQAVEMMMREERELEDHTSRAPAEFILNNANGEEGFDDVDSRVDSAPESE
jgi:Type III secretion protein YscO